MSKDDISTLHQLNYCAVYKKPLKLSDCVQTQRALGGDTWDGGSVEGACGPRTQSWARGPANRIMINVLLRLKRIGGSI